MSNLRDGVIKSLTAVDYSATYYGWRDFWLTLQEILEAERIAMDSDHPWLNAPDYNSVRSPGDHPDHKATADALRKFAASTYSRAWWATYDIRNRPSNLFGAAYDSKKTVFDAYAKTVLDETTKNGNPVPRNDVEWNWWGDRSYVTLRNFGDTDD